MKLIVVGCGRLGSELAESLSEEGHEVAIIDRDPNAFSRLGTSFRGIAIEGDCLEREILLKAGVERTDGFAAVTNDDETNVVSAFAAKVIFKVPKVVIRIYDPSKADLYKRLGVPMFAPTTLGAHMMKDILCNPDFYTEFYFGGGEVKLVEIQVPDRLVGRSVEELTIPGRIVPITVVRNGVAALLYPGTYLQENDLLGIIVEEDSLEKLREMLGI
jgi:trk system potassium uptake protein TrkA